MLLNLTAFSLALSLVFALPKTDGNFLPRDNTVQSGFIDVSVATLWTNPNKPRQVDSPALTNPVQIEKWLDKMTVDQYGDLTTNSRTQTQALYGSPISILEHQEGWYKIAVPGQLTSKNKHGYPGWVPKTQVSLDSSYGKLQLSSPFTLVDKSATTALYRDVHMRDKVMDISYDTRLPVIHHHGPVIQVAVHTDLVLFTSMSAFLSLPPYSGGSAYVSGRDTSIYDSESNIPYPPKEDLVNAAKLFLGRPYLWGGTSAFAFDCSGFTHTLYHAHGITIGRDADAEADFTNHGAKVDKSDLQAGDLLFYANDFNDSSTIYHVAMYVGNGEMAEAYDAGTPVRITDVRFGEDYWGAERFLRA